MLLLIVILGVKIKGKIKPKIKGGGQECPPYTDFTGIAITSSTRPTSFCTNGSA